MSMHDLIEFVRTAWTLIGLAIIGCFYLAFALACLYVPVVFIKAIFGINK